jgi:hypothetical protein
MGSDTRAVPRGLHGDAEPATWAPHRATAAKQRRGRIVDILPAGDGQSPLETFRESPAKVPAGGASARGNLDVCSSENEA